MIKTPRLILANGLACPYCGRTLRLNAKRSGQAPTRDHVNPKSLGGGPTIICCRRCNQHKADQALSEWAATLTRTGDRRASRVRALDDGLKNGTLRIRTEIEASMIAKAGAGDVGLAEGLFA